MAIPIKSLKLQWTMPKGMLLLSDFSEKTLDWKRCLLIGFAPNLTIAYTGYQNWGGSECKSQYPKFIDRKLWEKRYDNEINVIVLSFFTLSMFNFY